DVRETVALGEEACFARDIQIELRLDHPEGGARQGVVEAKQQLIGFDFAPLADEDRSNNAAVRVLHLFDVALDHNAAAGDDRAGDLCCRSPAADTADPEHQGSTAEKVQLADGHSWAMRRGGHCAASRAM